MDTIKMSEDESKKNLYSIVELTIILKIVNFFQAIDDLSQIRLYPGITTAQLAKKIELSQRSVQRYIATLRVAGELIEYDRNLKEWKLVDGKSALWDDW